MKILFIVVAPEEMRFHDFVEEERNTSPAKYLSRGNFARTGNDLLEENYRRYLART